MPYNFIIEDIHAGIAVDFGYKETQNKISSFDLTVFTHDIYNADEHGDLETFQQSLLYCQIVVRENGEDIKQGIILDVVEKRHGTDEYWELDCKDLYALYEGDHEPYEGAYYEDMTAQAIANDLIAQTIGDAGQSEWEIEYINLNNIKTTIDLRDKRPWQAFLALAEATGNFVARPTINAANGRFILRFGGFGEQEDDIYIIDRENVVKPIKQKVKVDMPIKRLYLESGKSADTRLTLNTFVTQQTGYPVVVDTKTGKGYIDNTFVSKGRKEQERRTVHKTKNDTPPNTTSKNNVIQALYNYGVERLKQAPPFANYVITCLLPRKPQIGEDIWVKRRVETKVHDLASGNTRWAVTRHMERFLRIVEVKYKAGEPYVQYDDSTQQEHELKEYELTLTDGKKLIEYNANKILLDKFDENTSYDTNGAVTGVAGIDTQQVHMSGVAPNTTTTSNAYPTTDARLFVFNLPNPVPKGSQCVLQTVVGAVNASGNPVVVHHEVEQKGTFNPSTGVPILPWKFRVTDVNGTDWDTSSDIKFTVQFSFLISGCP